MPVGASPGVLALLWQLTPPIVTETDHTPVTTAARNRRHIELFQEDFQPCIQNYSPEGEYVKSHSTLTRKGSEFQSDRAIRPLYWDDKWLVRPYRVLGSCGTGGSL